MKSHSKRILSLVFALLMAFQQVMFAAQTVDLLTPAEQTQTVDLLTGEEENKTVDLLTPAEPSASIEQPVEQSKPIIEENKVNENQTVDLLTPGDDEVVPEEGKKSTTTILIGGEEEEETQDDSWDLTPAEITVPEENHDEEEKKDATFEDEEHHENAGVLPWSTDLVKPWSIYREPKKVYRPGEDLDLTELLVEIKTGRSGSLYNIEDLINDEFTTITRIRKSDGEKVRLDDKIYEDETMTIHMDGCQDLTIDFTVDENLKDEEEALEAFQENLIREEFRDGLDFSLYLIKKGERENPIVAYSLDPHKLTPLGNGVDKKLKDGPLFDLKDINTWDRFDIETIGKVKAILERSAEINNTENVRKKLITQLAIWNVTSNIIPREIDATVSETEETETTELGPELKPTDEEEIPEEKEEEPIEIIDPTTPEEEIESVKQDDEVEVVEEQTEIEKTEAEEKTESEEPVEENTQENKESEKIEEQAPVQSTVHKIVFDAREIDLPYDEVELSDEEYTLYNELTSLEAIELKSEDEDLKIYEPIIEETENPYADLVTIGESDIDSIERVETEVTFDAVDYSFQNLYHTLETSSMLGFGQPRDFNVLLKATMKASRKIVEGDKFEVEILSKTLPILNGEEGRANDIQIDGKVVATAEYIAEEHKIVYTFVEDLDTDKVEIEQEFKQIKEEKAALLNMLDVSENLVLDAVRGAEGDEDSEENPDELEISPEFEENLIELKLGNTPVQYNGVSFETKKFRLKTTMTAKAYPIWQIPVGWTFVVNIGPYLKPDHKNYPLKNLYNPDKPKEVIAEPSYNEATHTITYTYKKSLSSTKTLDIDQYLAFDTDNIDNKDKIDINISVEPKNNPKQQMPTKTVYRDDRSPVITSAFEVEFDQNGEPNLNNQYKFFEYGPSYKVTFDASANPIIENREVKAVEWTVVFDGNGEKLNSDKLDLITNFTAVKNSGLEKIEIEDVMLNGEGITLNDNMDMGDKFLINDSKYFDGHNNSESVYTFKFKTPVDSKQKAYVLDIAAKLRGVNKTGAVRLIMPAYEGARLEMVSPNDMTHSNRTTISGKFTAENYAEWIVTEEVSTGDQGSLPLIERNISENQTLDSLDVAYYGLDKDGKMHQISKKTERNNPIKAGNLDGEKTFAPGTIAVYEYKTTLKDSDKPQTYTLSNGAISKYRDVDVNITWSKRVENSKYPEETLILSEKDNEVNSASIKINKENDPPQSTSVVITKVPNVKIWNIGKNGEPEKIEYKIKQEMPGTGKSNNGKEVKYGEVYKRYEPVTGIYEIQNYIVEDKGSESANITINKTDEGGKPLSGAKFKLFGIQNTEEQNKSETFTIEGISGQNGLIEFNNIPSGIYTLKEERAPEGYTPLSKNETITVNDDGSVEWTNNIIKEASFETGSAATGWKSDPKYYNGSFSWAGYMNSIDYTEVDKNNNFTSYIMLKPDVNSFRPGSKELTYTDRCTRVSMFGQNLDITDAQIFDVYPSEREQVKNAMYNKTAGKLSLGNDLSNIGNNSGMIVKESNFYDDVVGQYVHTIKIPYKRFGEPDLKEPEKFEGWAFLIKVTGKINDTTSDSIFSYKWLTTSAPKINDLNSLLSLNERKIQTKIESDTTIPVAENRNSALNPTFTIVNESAKLTKLNIQKQDDRGNELAGAEFRLYNSDNELINSEVTTATGKLTFEGLAPGEYILKETKSPEGYHNPELTFKLIVSQDGSILYSATDKEGNSVPEGDYYRVGDSSSIGPSIPTGETEITVQKAIMYLDEKDHYGKTPGVWEEAAYESYSFEGNFHIENAKAGESWIMDFDDNWNFTQWSGKLPNIMSETDELIAKGEIDYTNNQIKYTLVEGYVDNHKILDCGIKLNSIRPSKYYVKNNGNYAFRDVINVGANQKVVDTNVNADLFQFYGERGGNQYITQNVDIYKDKNEDRYFMRNIALFNAKGVKNFNGEKIARIYYGSSINNGKEILFGDKQEPTYKPVKVIVYKVEHPNSENMPLSCGIRPSVEPGYTKIAEYNDFSTEFVQTKGTSPDRVTMKFNPKRVDINDNYRPTIYSNDKVQFLITLPDKISGYVIEQFYEITDVKRFENTYTQTFMFHSGGSKTGGWEQIRPTLNSGAGIGGDYIPPKPKNYDLTVFNKKQPGEFVVKKVSEKDSDGNVKELAGAEFTLYDENGKVVRRNSSNIKGIVEFKGLSEGTYTLKETVAPEGYKATDKTITVQIDKDGKVTFEGLKQDDDIFEILNNPENPTIQVTNKPNKTKVTILKVDEKVNDDGSRKVLPGAVFGLFDENGNAITKNEENYEVETNKDGKATFDDLEPGTYIIEEIKAPNGYEKTNKTWTVVVGEDNKVVVTENFVGSKYDFNIIEPNDSWDYTYYQKKVLRVKQSIEGPSNGSYNVKIQIEGLSPNDRRGSQLYMYFDTNNFDFEDDTIKENGWYGDTVYFNNSQKTYTFKFKPKQNIGDGNYNPINGILYLSYPISQEFFPKFKVEKTTGKTGSTNVPLKNEDNEFSFNISNKYKGYEVEFKKIAEENGNEIKLTGAKFKLQMKDGENYVDFNPVYTEISDAEGKIKFSGLKPGEYKVVETDPPAGYYVLNKEVKFFKVDDDGNVFIMENGVYKPYTDKNSKILNTKPGDGKFKIKKTDENNKGLQGVKFNLYNSRGDLVGEFTTDENGEIHFTNLPYDKYYVKEFSTKPGYILDNEVRVVMIGQKWAKGTLTGRDVSDKLILSKESTMYSIINNDYFITPNNSEVIQANLKYKVADGANIQPGDTFTVVASENVDLDGIGRSHDDEYDIYGPAGLLATAEINKNRREITYTFTEYAKHYNIRSINIGMLMAVNRIAVPGDKYGKKNIDVSVTVGNSNLSKNFDVQYNYGDDVQVNACLVKYDEDTNEFIANFYLNHKHINTYGKMMKFTSNSEVEFKDVQVKYLNKIASYLPWSFGIKDIESDLSDLGSEYYSVNKTNDGMILSLNGNYFDNMTYRVVVKGKVTNPSKDRFALYAEYINYNESNQKYYQMLGLYKSLKKTSSDGDGDIVLTFTNHKNKIEYTKVDGSIAGTADDKKPQGASQGSNEPIETPKPVFSSAGKPLQGVFFQLQKKNSSDEFVNYGDPIESDTNGKFSWEGLSEGEYQVVETEALPGYSKPKNPVSKFKVNKNGEIVNIEDNTTIIKTIIENYKKPDIEFNKIDGRDKTPLKDAEFTLYKAYNDENANNELKFGMVNKDFEFVQDEKKAYKVISGEDGKLEEGKFKFEKLEDGIYAVKETKEPDGYIKFKNYVFYFKVEGTKIYRVNKLGKYVDDTKDKNEVSEAEKDEKSLIVDMEKDKAQENLIQIENFKAEYPSTGGVGALPFVFIGMMIMMVGAYMFIRRRDALYE